MTVVAYPCEATKQNLFRNYCFQWEITWPSELEPVTGGLRSGSAHHPSYARFPTSGDVE
jgi:hypothetical protein